MMDDHELLRHYSRTRSQEAFSELVKRHVDMVYSAALRQMSGDHHRAQEVTQMVFSDLARKAASLLNHPLLPAWLHRGTRFSALRLLRADARRRRYEQAAGRESALLAGESGSLPWEKVRPVLDEAIDELPEADRHAVVLRYFSNRAFGDVGRQLGMTENAARMRVDRALDKLRDRLETRGIASSSTALATALAGNAVSAAPGSAALAVAHAAVIGAGGSAGSLLAFMSLSKLPVSLTVAALVCGTSVLALQQRGIAQLDNRLADNAEATAAISSLEATNHRLREAANAEKSLQDTAASLSQLRVYAAALRDRAAKKDSKAPSASLQAAGSVSALNLNQLDMQPVPKMQVRPQYPAALKQMGVGGQVLVDFLVGPDGKVYNAHALSASVNDGSGGPDNASSSPDPGSSQAASGNSAVHLQTFVVQHDGPQATNADSPNPTGETVQPGASDFADSAVQAVSQWQFKPGTKQGAAVYTHMQVPIVFNLSSPPTAATWF
jgi:RNA polymerase sigma factor (sigma-70 family)